MQITIDTQKDSKEDIRKAVALLSTLADEKEHSSNIFEDSNSFLGETEKSEDSGTGTNAFSSMFGDNNEIPVLGDSEDKKEIEDKEGESLHGSSEAETELEDEEDPQIMEY